MNCIDLFEFKIVFEVVCLVVFLQFTISLIYPMLCWSIRKLSQQIKMEEDTHKQSHANPVITTWKHLRASTRKYFGLYTIDGKITFNHNVNAHLLACHQSGSWAIRNMSTQREL